MVEMIECGIQSEQTVRELSELMHPSLSWWTELNVKHLAIVLVWDPSGGF